MIYKAYIEQEEEGCDFTIGCGKILIDLKSDKKKDALRELEDILEEEFFESDKLKSAILLEIATAVKISIPYLSYDKRTEEEKEKELKEYKKLRRKYGKKPLTSDDKKEIKKSLNELENDLFKTKRSIKKEVEE
jgi:hypothetical protein